MLGELINLISFKILLNTIRFWILILKGRTVNFMVYYLHQIYFNFIKKVNYRRKIDKWRDIFLLKV